jgi:hypothetical protein
MPPPPHIILLPATISDLPTLSAIQAAAYKSDLVSYLMTLDRPDDWSYTDWLQRTTAPLFHDPEISILKAVDEATGRIVGWISWAAKGVTEHEQKHQEEQEKPKLRPDPPHAVAAAASLTPSAEKPETGNVSLAPSAPPKKLGRQILSALIASDSQLRYATHMLSASRPSEAHLILQGLFVQPTFQNFGIGTALLTQLTRRADAAKLACWVHASPASHGVYEKAGFREVGRLEVDLGEFVGTGDGKARVKGNGWGGYVFRYMVRDARRVGEEWMD